MADGPRDAWNRILVDALDELDADAAGIALSAPGVQTSVCRGALPAIRETSPFTVMYAASLTKQLMGTFAAVAITKGRMDYRTPVTDLVPALPSWMCTVQIEHLLHHTSGLPEVARDIRSPVADNAILLELLRAEAGLTAPPGTVHAYSNTGYVALALALEAAFDMPIAQLGVEMVFARWEWRTAGSEGRQSTDCPDRSPHPARSATVAGGLALPTCSAGSMRATNTSWGMRSRPWCSSLADSTTASCSTTPGASG